MSSENKKVIGFRLSYKQALVMLDVLKASVQHCDGTFGGYPKHIRERVVNQIINQQSDEIIELTPENITWNWEDLMDNGENEE